MIESETYENIQACFAAIELEFEIDLVENRDTQSVLLRGENSVYPKSESSMKRFLTGPDGRTMRPFNIVSPFIDFEEVYAEFHSTAHGLDEEEGAGFLQHYGFPTDLFDLTPCFETARFFASYEREEDPVGMIGAFDRSEMEAHFEITNLTRHPFAQRPKNQLAFAARPTSRIVDLKDPGCDRLYKSRWYRFKKSDADLAFARQRLHLTYPAEREIAHFFPRDLDHFVRSHFTYADATEDQRRSIEAKLESIRRSVRA